MDLTNKTISETTESFLSILEGGMHGLCFSPYEEGQKPGDVLTEAQVRRRLQIIQPFTNWVRSFSCTEGNEWIPKIAREMGLRTLVGAWLGKDPATNEKEIEGLIQLAREGFVDVAAVGNEVLYRNDLDKSALLKKIHDVKLAIPSIPVGYVDAYYEFTNHPDIVDACDVILANCYPYWEGCSFDHSLVYMNQMYQQARQAAKGKKVIITETGWPSQGETLEGAIPSMENAMKYFIYTQYWAKQDKVDIFYFSSFDEPWKIGAEGEVGAYWGLWDKQEKLKFI
ncbi:MAG: glycosyl hydrolase family 17 protein [Bacteroidota bacterium]